jgi:cytoskeletal protein CcmA (bactofilin family)
MKLTLGVTVDTANTTGEGNMLFNKKAEDEFTSDFVTGKRSMATGSPADQAIAAARKAGGTPTRSVIDSWLTITGNLESEGEVQVDGRIHGHIRCTHLTVGRDATIEGNITADEVVVRGTVKGMIRANRVILQDSAHVRSEIYHKKLAIEEGASFEGNSRCCEDPLNVAVAEAETMQLKSMAADMKAAQKGNGRYMETDAAVA